MRRPWSWTDGQIKKLNWIRVILDELKDYLPVTLRQIHYQLVSKGLMDNTTSEYTMLSKRLKYARIDGLIPWEAIEDRTRRAFLNEGWEDKDKFVATERDDFLVGYRRDLQQGQENYIEIWLEKDALAGIFERIIGPLCIPLCPTRGFSSVTFLRDLRNRILTSQKMGQRTTMLYFGDFDPSGKEMLPSMQITLEDDLGLENINYDPIALIEEQIEEYDLPVKMGAAKKTDSRYKKFVKKYGPRAVELDALSPKILREIIQRTMGKYLDLSKLEQHLEEERKEKLILREFKQKAQTFIDENWMPSNKKDN